MNVKIKSAGVACLIGDNYDRVYAALKKQLIERDEQLFTERTPGYEYLQWELPGEGWTALSESDPLVANVVRREWLRRHRMVCDRFGRNQDMAQRVLSVPDESYVFYKKEEDGYLSILLTAWGYRYPERVQGGGPITGQTEPKEQKEHVVIQLLHDGNPVPGKILRLNGLSSEKTDSNGMFEVGDLTLDYEFDVEVDKVHHLVKVKPGQGRVELDITTFSTVTIVATLDERPYKGAVVSLAYGKRQMALTANEQGKVEVCLPLDLQNVLCTVELDGEIQQSPLTEKGETFTFRLKTPEPVKVSESYGEVEVYVTRNGQPYSFASVLLEYAGQKLTFTTDVVGKAAIRLLLDTEKAVCTVTIEGEVQRKVLSEGVTTFTFCLSETNMEEIGLKKDDSEVPPVRVAEHPVVEVIASLDGQPYVGIPVEVNYGGHHWLFTTDNAGMVQTQVPFYEEEEWCTVTVGEETLQKKLLINEKTSFLFQFKSPDTLPLQSGRNSWKSSLLGVIVGLCIVALLVITYFIGGEILFT